MKAITPSARILWLAVHGVHQLDDAITAKLAEPVTLGDWGADTLAARIAGLPFAAVAEALAEVEALQRKHGTDVLLASAPPPSEKPDDAHPQRFIDEGHSLDALVADLRAMSERLEPFRKHLPKPRRVAA